MATGALANMQYSLPKEYEDFFCFLVLLSRSQQRAPAKQWSHHN